ncbi:MAG TPA: hypothetical protein VG796_24825 [Verrucomicrobiales bacterium]|nr:hypothetical protein [Verrucomicrobiales bacterium]
MSIELIFHDLAENRASTAIRLSELEDIQVILPDAQKKVLADVPSDAHSSYHLPDFATVAPIVIGITGLATGWLGLAKVLFEYRKEVAKAKGEKAKSLSISLNGVRITIADYDNAAELQAALEQLLHLAQKAAPVIKPNRKKRSI